MKLRLVFVLSALLAGVPSFGQSVITAKLLDSSSGEPVGFATASITRTGATKPVKYVLSGNDGSVKIEGVRPGTYTFKAELLGYKALSFELKVPEKTALGEVKLNPDNEQLEAAKISATGNAIIVKKDTIEYNASSYKITENDVLEDLLTKLPGVEVSETGAITVNGQEVKKITIDGKTFFLDDPQLASKNIPARIINKLKVVEKKSDQAEFTGIDDGETETVIDLSVKKGMMKGLFGNVSGGGGHDIPTNAESVGDWRFQGAGFLGKFTDKSQISVILNGNNTNNRGFNDLSGNMMRTMRGGGGGMGRGSGGWGTGNGITTSWMGGANGAWDLFDKKMELAGNYLYNGTDNVVSENALKTAYQQGGENLIYKTDGYSNTRSDGHRFGVRLKHTFSENTSIIFEPQVNFGTGHYMQKSDEQTFRGSADGTKLNDATTDNTGENKNVSASGFFLFRQRLGIPGRTLTAMARYRFSNNDLSGLNNNSTITYGDDASVADRKDVFQTFTNRQQSTSIMGRLNYTEPLGNHFYVEGNYMYSWNNSSSNKQTLEADGTLNPTYSNEISNTYVNQEIGANLLYQTEKFRAQLGFAAKPVKTHNVTRKGAGYQVDTTFTVWNFAPQAMLWWEMSDNSNARMFYYGSSAQPSMSQLIPIPDNTNPLNVSFGNPSLRPNFNHSIRGDVRYNNKQTFTSFNIRFNGGFVQNPVVSSLWYDGGRQYSMPFNGPSSGNASISGFVNLPIAKSNFSVSNFIRTSWNMTSSFVGKDIDMDLYDPQRTGELDYALFLEDYNSGKLNFVRNKTNTMSFMDRFRATLRQDNLELSVSARTRMSRSWYDLASQKDNTLTWNNQAQFNGNWTWDLAGITLKGEFNYNWYRGYSTPMPSEYIFNAEIQKALFKKKLTLSLKGYDILGQSKNLSVTDDANYHNEVLNNTLGRYIILSITYRFGNFDRSRMQGRGGRPPMMR